MPPRRYLITGAAACALLVAAACSSSPTRSSTPAPPDWFAETEPDPLDGATSLTFPPTELVPAPVLAPTDGGGAGSAQTDESPGEPAPRSRGLIAAAGPTGLRLLAPDGALVGELGPAHIVTQPTWSRDGRRLVATLTDPASGTSQVAVVDITTGDVLTAAARRPYFFYSWNHEGTRVAALGPGSSGGTALDILDGSGAPTSTSSLQSDTVFVAWEPEGSRLLIHAGPQLYMLSDPDSPGDHENLGPVGFGFQAAAWVPGTQDFLYVDSVSPALDTAPPEDLSGEAGPEAGPRLVRRHAGSGATVNLGPATGFAAMAVHPQGSRAALSLLDPPTPESEGSANAGALDSLEGTGDGAAPERPAPQQWDGSVQIVDLATGERSIAIEHPGFWLEWSPDGRNLLIATALPTGNERLRLTWHVWNGESAVEVTQFTPSVAFARNYLPFADQYDETPRLWSPDSDAITFGANTADGDVTVVARIDRAGEVASLGPSDVSFWSPLP